MYIKKYVKYIRWAVLLMLFPQISIPLLAQDSLKVSVVHRDTKSPIAFANIYFHRAERGAATDLAGRASFTFQDTGITTDTISCSFIGFEEQQLIVNLKQDR
nr:carboxypeptidase-like regulatory domain-containing protein [Saprospiraceae bacterium]